MRCGRQLGAQLPVRVTYSVRGSPQNDRPMVPGPVWLPMVVPILHTVTGSASLGKASSTMRASSLASSSTAEW